MKDNYIDISKDILEHLKDVDLDKIINILKNSDKIFLCGNGGSSSTASHLAQDFQKMCGLKTICLSDNTPLVTAWSNDLEYSLIFQKQLEILASKEDTLIVFSGSGNSENIIFSLGIARLIGMKTIAFVGIDGGEILKDNWADNIIYIQSDMQHAEDWHLILGHIICQILSK